MECSSVEGFLVKYHVLWALSPWQRNQDERSPTNDKGAGCLCACVHTLP